MANEITFSTSLTYKKAGLNGLSAGGNGQFTQTGDKYEAGVQIIGTTEESLTKGDIGTIGWLYAKNLDPTNYVELGATAGNYSHKLLPGQFVAGPWGYVGTFIKANTAQCEVEFGLVEL